MLQDSHTMQQHLEHELWLRELGFFKDEIDIMKHHLSDVYYSRESKDVIHLVKTFDEKFNQQKKWLNKMEKDLQQFDEPMEQTLIADTIKKSFRLQMQANRIVNEELKDSFLSLLNKWM